MDGTSFIKCGLYRIPPCPAWGDSCFGKLSVHQIRRRLVQFLPHFPPCFLKSLRKEPFVFFSREVTLKFVCVVFMDFICVIHRQLQVTQDNVEFLTSTFKAACWEKVQDLSFTFPLSKKKFFLNVKVSPPPIQVPFLHHLPQKLLRAEIGACHFRQFSPNCEL